MSKILPAAKCSQMSNPKAGTGSGGDRCVEATCAMIDATYKIGPKAKEGMDPERLMYSFTEDWNDGSDISALESAARIDTFLAQSKSGVKSSTVGGTYANVTTIVDRGHIAYSGVNDYRKLRLGSGDNPYMWDVDTQPGPAGHVLLIVGYGPGVVSVHDPLRALAGQPADYSIESFEAAGWQVIGEIVGPRLDTPEQPKAREWVIQPGNTMWGLADYFYGDPETTVKWIEAANPTKNPRALRIGDTLLIPPPQVAEPKKGK